MVALLHINVGVVADRPLSTACGLKGQVIPAQGNALGIRAVTPFGLKGQLKNLILCSSMMSRITGNLTWPYRP
jgi:hypothetical protein